MRLLVIAEGRRCRIVAPSQNERGCGLLNELERLARHGKSTEKAAAGLMATLNTIADQGRQAASPLFHEASKKDGLFRIRKGDLRLYFFFDADDGELVICSHTAVKKQQETRSADIARAVRLRREFESARAAKIAALHREIGMRENFRYLDETRKTKVYQQESAKLDFAVQLNARMAEAQMSRADLAAAIQHSPAYVTKVLRGDNNLTIETMVELVYAVKGRLHLKISDDDQRVRWRGVVDGGRPARAKPYSEAQAWARSSRSGPMPNLKRAAFVETAEEQGDALVT